MTGPPSLVLASASARRTRILSMLGLDHEILPARLSEEREADETPREHAERLAGEKARVVASERPGALVLAGDTVVVVDGRLVGKPADAEDAVEILLGLAGRTHEVATGLAVVTPAGRRHSRIDAARVRVRPFGRKVAEAYVATGEPLDKAGAYGIQGLGASLVTGVEGDYYAVVGLSVTGLVALLERSGWRYAFGSLHRTDPSEALHLPDGEVP